jgi:hypothetical protein
VARRGPPLGEARVAEEARRPEQREVQE